MGIKAEEIRQAKKFLENKKISIKKVKPLLLAKVSSDLKVSFSQLTDTIKKVLNGTSATSDQTKTKRS
jgi:succinate dehydrogenase/fumarate reductase-like Fe-S protein|tara:strand:- start:3667 stop:3870 length:204 start_codon:yes stop_codon:yes gene_type:complete